MSAERLLNWIGGQWVPPQTGAWIDVVAPADGSLIARVGDSGADDVDHAVASARTAFEAGTWSRLAVAERAAALRRLADELEQRVPALTEKLVRDIGCPARLTAAMQAFTPVQHLRAFADMESVLAERALEQGAKVMVGGGIPAGLNPDGFYYSPTILRDVTPDMDIAHEEVFGQVLALIKYDSIDEAVKIANDTGYGLASAVWGNDIARAAAVSDRLESGLKWINEVGQIDVTATPMAGRKASGLGTELGPDGLLAYTLPTSTYTSHGDGTQAAVYGLVGSHWEQG